ncbi:MAG TPA: RT0821/Lpp0805 family surface protein [Acetobacteraceae bacterium]
MHRGPFSAKAGLLASLAGLIALFATLTGCGSYRPVGIPSMPPAALPTYGLGDSYQLSDGSNDSVTAADDDVVHWRDNDGAFVTSRDILAPRLTWADSATLGERGISGDPSLLFPLRPAKSVKFTATRTVHPRRGGQQVTVQEDWVCDVIGAVRVTTGAGDFDTWRIDCTMRETPAVTGNGLIQRRFYYAPDIGFYVRTDEAVGDGPFQITELTGYTSSDLVLADSALRQRSYALQRALETQLSGSQAKWSDADTGAAGIVTLVDTKHSAQYGWCRDFAERIQSSGRAYSLHGTGCRDPAKIWDIVAMAPGKGGAN